MEDSSDSDSCENFQTNNTYEKKSHVLSIPHIFLQNAQQSGNNKELDFVYGLLKPLLVLCCEYLIEIQVQRQIPYANNFYSQLMTFVNRVIILKPDQFM